VINGLANLTFYKFIVTGFSFLMQTQEIILYVGQGFSLVEGNPKGLPYKRFNSFGLVNA